MNCPTCHRPMPAHPNQARHRFGVTQRQQQALAFVENYIGQNGGHAPSYNEIKNALQLRSKSGVHRLLKGLEERGHLTFAHGRARSITLAEPAHAG